MITLLNMIFANPLAYLVFPNMVNTYNTGTMEKAVYTGHIVITDSSGNTHNFTNTSTIDFTPISGLVTIDNITDRGSVRLGRWLIAQSIVITNDITITVTPIAEVSSDGATITPQYEVKYNTYRNGELTESAVITPDNVVLQSNVEWITISNNQIVVVANTNTEARQGQVTIQVSYQEYNTSANYNVIQAGHGIEDSIMDAMVLWYDLAKQGATNESMAENPVLRDLSGNGHDATCYNFAWSGMSGVGGYKTNYTAYYFYNGRGTLEITDTKIVIKNVMQDSALIETVTTYLGLIPAYKIKVSGLPDGALLSYTYYIEENNGGKSRYNIISDGEYELPANTYLNQFVGFSILNFIGECNITIEQLPLYPNALVSDGVDDYCLVEELPILTDFTVFTKRRYISMVFNSALLSKRDDVNFGGHGDNIGAFQLERNNSEGRTIFSFGKDNEIAIQQQEDIVYLTANSYNGNPINKGDATDTSTLNIFNFGGGNHSPCSNVALYSVILFNRTLTPEEIEWVKTNLIETEQ